MIDKIMNKIDNCDKKTLERLEIISDVKVFNKEVDDYVKYDNRKTTRDELLNHEFKEYAMLYIA